MPKRRSHHHARSGRIVRRLSGSSHQSPRYRQQGQPHSAVIAGKLARIQVDSVSQSLECMDTVRPTRSNLDQLPVSTLWGLTGLSLLIMWSLWAIVVVDANASAPLQGSARIDQAESTQEMPLRGSPNSPPRIDVLEFSDAFDNSVHYAPYSPHNPLIQQADQLLKSDKLAVAEQLYRTAFQQNPQDAGAWNGLGKVSFQKTTVSNQTFRRMHDILYKEAIQAYYTALRYQPGYVEAYLNLSDVYMAQHRMGNAGDAIEHALRLAPNRYDVLLKQGEWLIRSDRAQEAWPYLKRAVEQNPGDAWGHYYLSFVFAAREDLDRALDQLNVADYQLPNNALIQTQQGNCYAQQGNGSASVEAWRRAIALKPELTLARRQLANFYQRRGDWTLALEQLKTIDDTDPPSWEITELIGQLSIRNNQPDIAVQYYERWLKDNKDNVEQAEKALSEAKLQVARQDLRNRDLVSEGDGKRNADQAVTHNPNNFEARMVQATLDQVIKGPTVAPPQWDPNIVDVALQHAAFEPYQSYEKGEILLTRYRFQEAELQFEQARRTGEGQRSDLMFADLFLKKGLPTLAEETFRRILAKTPDDPTALLGLGKARKAREQAAQLVASAQQLKRQSNKQSIAIQEAETALTLNLKNADAHYLLGQVYEKQHQFEKAADHYYGYLQLKPDVAKKSGIPKKIDSLKKKLSPQNPSDISGL